MSFTYGFFNSVNHDRTYNAEQFSTLFDGIINDGVFINIGSNFNVNANSGMVVQVGTGRAWFNGTWSHNDAIMNIIVDDAELVLDRIDAVVLEVDKSDAGRKNSIKIVKGTPSTNPVKPIMQETEFIHQHPLAYVTIKAGITEITQSEIQTVIGTSECPYITGILQTVNADNLLAQWDDQFGDWLQAVLAKLDQSVLNNLKAILYTEIGQTLKAGTSTLTFTSGLIRAMTKIDVYTSDFSVQPIGVSATTGSVTYTFNPPSADTEIHILIMN